MYESIDCLPREKLLELIAIFSKDWIAHDGLWFQSIERKLGMDEAIEHDINALSGFAAIEARRIKKFLDLPERAGLDGLRIALNFRLVAPLNEYNALLDKNELVYSVSSCRVQTARARKGMPYHPCKPVGLAEYSYFAQVIDDRITTECLSCYPDITRPESSCVWRFTLVE